MEEIEKLNQEIKNLKQNRKTAGEITKKQIDLQVADKQIEKSKQKIKQKEELKRQINEMLADYLKIKQNLFGISQRQASSSLNKSSSFISMVRTNTNYLPKYQVLDIIDDEIQQINENIHYLIKNSILDEQKTIKSLDLLRVKISKIKGLYVDYMIL